MDLSDPLTVAEIVGEFLLVAVLVLTAWRKTRLIQKLLDQDINTANSDLRFTVYRDQLSSYGLALLPLVFLAMYLALRSMALITSDFYVLAACFFLLLTIGPPLIFAVRIAPEFLVISDLGIEKHRGSRTVTFVNWNEVTILDVSSNTPHPRSILIRSGDKTIQIEAQERSVVNRGRLVEVASKRVPADKKTRRFVEWLNKGA